MTRIVKRSLQRMALVCTLSLGLLTSYSPSLQSQTPESTSSSFDEISLRFVPPPPPDQGSPSGRHRGGASRGPCLKYEALAALVPVTGGFVWGLTSAERPTFWFFVPEPLTAELPIEFVLQDEADNYVYKTTRKMPKMQPGVVSISVPSTAKPLEIGKRYRWTFSIACDPARPSASVFVQGSLQRMALDPVLERQLEAATLRERVDLYAANGIWYDALTNLIQLRQTNPEDASLVRDWKSFLESVGLEAIAQKPIVQCCTLEK